MLRKEGLLKTEEYWFETMQNEIYRLVAEYMKNEGLNQSELAKKLGVSKGYISQIVNGNFNFSLRKLIELSLALNKAPLIGFKDIDEFIKEDDSGTNMEEEKINPKSLRIVRSKLA